MTPQEKADAVVNYAEGMKMAVMVNLSADVMRRVSGTGPGGNWDNVLYHVKTVEGALRKVRSFVRSQMRKERS